ncbi:kinesin-like protein [Chrysochromulina tobinii]|uniref:Kinesin-like protein n=1 Tax=Chrysochromulina tobinii TaxID=1460289 RepID=A0A0M0JWC1_9EUKA|nr:kinesin-like protein [Chrysochromulina tobinii]|eukprot:KOO30879.1 kinesin-like protein [Chrysochromulina sp. CCMP291]
MSAPEVKRNPSPSLSRPTKKPSRKGKAGSKSTAASSGDDSNAFRVAVRCRPLLPHERAKDAGGVLTLSKGTVTIAGGSDDSDKPGSESPRASPRRSFPDASSALKPSKSFTFDHVYDEYSTQEEVYAQFVAPFTAKFLAGHNVTLFAYGQTGTGKTHTVIGGEAAEDRGVVPRFVEAVFGEAAAEAARAKAEAASAPAALVLSEAEAADAPSVLSEARVVKVHRQREVYKLERVDKETWRYVPQPGRASMRVTRANLVDLAGSEDARETCANGATLREAADINKSLFTLRKAIEHLALKRHTRSVFQEETLTKMLASSLLGNAYSLMIATISPTAAAIKHTRNTLHYAGTASTITLAPPKTVEDDAEVRNAELHKENKKLLLELEQRASDFSELQVMTSDDL